MEYRTDVEKVRALLPDDVDLAEEDPGAVAFIWADWQSCSSGGAELLDPARSQYKEAFAVVRCRYEGAGLLPLRADLGDHRLRDRAAASTRATRRSSAPSTRPGRCPTAEVPRASRPAAAFGATLAAYDHRLAEATITLTEPSDTNGFVNALPMLHHRQVRRIERGAQGWALYEVLTMSGVGFEHGPAWRAEARLELFDSPWDDVASTLPVREIISGYYVQVGTSWDGGTTLLHR